MPMDRLGRPPNPRPCRARLFQTSTPGHRRPGFFFFFFFGSHYSYSAYLDYDEGLRRTISSCLHNRRASPCPSLYMLFTKETSLNSRTTPHPPLFLLSSSPSHLLLLDTDTGALHSVVSTHRIRSSLPPSSQSFSSIVLVGPCPLSCMSALARPIASI